ncbi:MAG: hypothetical protein IJM97_08665 [Clostridia bacterium]|nr:hypothetical protein [Clostridia bacterium]
MKKVLFLVLIAISVLSFSSCRKAVEEQQTTKKERATEMTVEQAAGTDLSVDEIISIYNSSISEADEVTVLYTHAGYENLELDSEMFESAAKSVLEKTIKNNDTQHTTKNKSEIETILPKPVLNKDMIKSYSCSDNEVSLVLYDVENPVDEGAIKFYPITEIEEIVSQNNIKVDELKMLYTDCRLNFRLEDKKISDLSYLWRVKANGSFNLLLKEQKFAIDICMEEAYRIKM